MNDLDTLLALSYTCSRVLLKSQIEYGLCDVSAHRERG